MADDGYYRDQPRFRRKDPLSRWAWIFIGLATLALIWFIVVILLFANQLVTNDTLFGRGEGFWVGLATLLVVVSLLGLIFVIVGRLGAASAGGYLSADIDDTDMDPAPVAGPDPTADDTETVMATRDSDLGATRPEGPPDPARIDDPFGPDGRMLLSYAVPEDQPRGIYGDTWVPVDRDAVLNVKTLLAKTSGGNRP